MLDVVRDINGLHAQVLSSAELSLWARCEALDRHTIATALWHERTLLKTWAMRGTLHLLPTREWPLWRSAFRTYAHFYSDGWLRYVGVTHDEMDRLIDTACNVLTDEPMTRGELGARVSRQLGNPTLGEKFTQSWGTLLKPVAWRGGLCFGPNRGQHVTFVSPSAWTSGYARTRPKQHAAAALEPEHALLEIFRRFIGAYGPVSRDDVWRWWGGSARRATSNLRTLEASGTLTRIRLGTRDAWALTSELDALESASSSGVVRLLPAFDPYVIGASVHCAEMMSGGHRSQIFRNQGWLSPVLLVDGRMDGVWKHVRKGKRLQVEISPFKRASAATRRAASLEAERLAVFLGGSLEVKWT